MPCARVCGMGNMGNVGGRAEMDGTVPSPPSLPCRPVPGQNLTRSLGRQASPEPFLLLSGAGTPACQRGSGPGGRQNSWAHPGCMAGARAPSLVPVLHVSLVLPCRRFTAALPVRAGALAFLAQEEEGCWCTAHPGAPAECHKPAFLWAWAGKWGQESEVAMSCWG